MRDCLLVRWVTPWQLYLRYIAVIFGRAYHFQFSSIVKTWSQGYCGRQVRSLMKRYRAIFGLSPELVFSRNMFEGRVLKYHRIIRWKKRTFWAVDDFGAYGEAYGLFYRNFLALNKSRQLRYLDLGPYGLGTNVSLESLGWTSAALKVYIRLGPVFIPLVLQFREIDRIASHRSLVQ